MRKLSPSALPLLVASFGLVVAFASGCGRLKPAATPDGGSGGSVGGAGGSGGSTGGGSGRVLITISGTAAPHPLNALVTATVTPDAGTSDAAAEGGATDAVASEAGATEAGASEAGASEAGASEAGASEAGASEAGASEAGASEAGASEAGASEAGASEAGASEAGASEAGATAASDFSMLKVAIVDPTAVITNPNATPLASMTLDTTAGNCSAAAGCKFSLSGVDITNLTLGLVGTLEDTRTGAARVWVKTGTGMGTAAFLTAARTAKTAITDRHAFIVSRKLEAKLAAFAGVALGTTFAAGDLETRGFLIGHVVDKVSSAPTPAGVAGATVMAQGDFDVIYPNATFTGKGTATSATGIFLMVPHLKNNAPQSIVANWTVIPPTGDARAWEQHIAGSSPGNAFIIIMPANE